MTRDRWSEKVLTVVRSMAALIGLLLIGALMLWLVPAWLGHPFHGADRVKAVGDARTASVAFVAVLGAALTVYFTARTYRLSKEGQLTDRYAKAIEQLGSNQIDVRLGGIYALERVARDSERDQAIIIEVLAAFVRNRAKRNPHDHLPEPGFEVGRDIVAALTVLGRVPPRSNMPRIDLRGAGLDMLELSEANLANARLARCQLRFANLRGLNLAVCDLADADLTGAVLDDSNLKGAVLRQTQLKKAKLRRAILDDAKVLVTDMYMTVLTGAKLRGADLRSARLQGPVGNEPFIGLGRQVFYTEQLKGADLTGARLPKVMRNLDLRGVVGMTQQQLVDNWVGDDVLLPDGLISPRKRRSDADDEGPEGADDIPNADDGPDPSTVITPVAEPINESGNPQPT